MKQCLEFSNSCFHFIICIRHVRVAVGTFQLAGSRKISIFSGSCKLKLAKPKVEGTPTVGSILTHRGLYRSDSVVPIHRLPVPGRKSWMSTTETFLVYQTIIFEFVVPSATWCDPLFETRGATHCFLQHQLVRPIFFTTPVILSRTF